MITSFLTVAMKVLILFLLMAVGFVLAKKKILTKAGTDQMNFILLNVVIPCVIINAFEMDNSGVSPWNLGLTVAAGVFGVGIGAVIVKFCFHKEPSGRRQVLKFGAIFSNCSFMGFPLIYEIVGEEGMIYAAVFNTVITVAMWTVGFAVMRQGDEKISLLKVLVNPGTIGVCVGLPLLLFSWKLPDPFQSVIGFLADMNTPLAMICIGAFISGTNFLRIFKEKVLYQAAVIRLVLIPALVFAAMLPFRPDYPAMAVAVILTSAPTAGITAIFAAQFGHDSTLGAEVVTVSTLFSIVTIPLFCVLLQAVYGI